MSNQKLIFIDIDGTLLDHDKNLPTSAKKAIDQLQQEGHLIVIATGRGSYTFDSLRKELGIDSYVSFNGSYVVLKEKVIFTNPLNKEKLLALTEEGLKRDHPVAYMSESGMRANAADHQYINESISTLKIDLPVFDPAYHEGRELYQSLLFCAEGEEKYYEAKYPEFEFVRWHPFSVDILPAGGSKARGIQELVKALNFDEDHIYAFGDGLNDIEMLEYVKHSVAMGNAEPETKAVAKYVTKDVGDDGLYHGFKMVGLL